MASLRSLKIRIALTIFVLEGVMMGAALWLTSDAQTEALRRQQAAARNALLELVARVGRTALLTDELNELRIYFQALQRDPGVERVLLGNARGTVVGSADARDLGEPMPRIDAGPATDWLTVPIENASGRLGVLAIRFSSRDLLQAQAEARRLGLGIAAAGMTVIALVGIAMGVLLTRRLEQLTQAAGRMARGDRGVRAAVPGRDEVAELGRAFDAMADAVAQQERQLRAERETTALLLDSLAEAVYGVDLDGRCTFANQACARMLGATDVSALANREMAALIHRADVAKQLQAALRDGDPWHGEDEIQRLDGHRFAVECWTHPILREGRRVGAVVTFVDISERKRAQQALLAERNFSAAILGNAGAVMLVLDREGRIRRFNHAAEQASGYRFAEVEGRFPWDMLLPPEVADKVRVEAFDALATHPERLVGTYRNEWQHVDGSRRWIDWSNTLLVDAQRRMEYMISIGVDVTDKRAAEERIRVALREKELLLQEIYHRVKNNLQMVVSLLTLQARNTAQAEAREALQESASRIKSMALVHEQLYQSGDLSAIDFAQYLRQLVHHVTESQGSAALRVPAVLTADHVSLGVETAVPLGLLVNELLANAYKHGFPGERAGRIDLTLRQVDSGRVELVIADDGVGLPADFAAESVRSLGLRLVQSLSEQLDATARFEPAARGGCVFTLRFRPEHGAPDRLSTADRPISPQSA